MSNDYGTYRNRFLCAQSLLSAQAWLAARKLPAASESADEMIAAYYPGGLHWFIAQHLISPDEVQTATHSQE